MKRDLKKIFWVTLLITLFFANSQTYAQEEQWSSFGSNYDIIVLTPGLTRTITYTLSDTIWNNPTAFHTAYILTIGAGTLNIGLASASSLGEKADIVYATCGFVNTNLIVDYAYSSGSITQSIEVPEIGVGMLFTAIVVAIAEPDFPVTMSMNFSLTE